MNQIPNIEDKAFKDLINKAIKDFKDTIVFETEYEEGMRCHYQDAVNWVRAILEKCQERHHQQLQKARESERERILDYISSKVELCDTYYDCDVEMVPLGTIRKALYSTMTNLE